MNLNVLSTTLTNFIGTFSAAWGNILPAINYLIGTLLAIEIVLIGLFWALGGGDKLVNIFKKILYLGFWMWIVTSFPTICDVFVKSLIQAGTTAGGGGAPSLFNPSAIAGYGLDATAPLAVRLQNIGFNFVDAILIGISYILIVLCFLIIAWQVFYAVIEYYLMVAVTAILIPFGFLKPTKFLAEKAIAAIVASGIKLMVLAFILSVVEPTLAGLRFTSTDITFNEIFAMLLTSGAIAFLAWNAPGMAAGLLAGSPSLSAGTALQNAFAGSVIGGMGAQAAASATRSAASGATAGAAMVTRSAGAISMGTQLARIGGQGRISSVASGLKTGIKAGASSMVQSTFSKVTGGAARNSRIGARAAYAASGGKLTEGMKQADAIDRYKSSAASSSVRGQAPGWAKSAMYQLSKGGGRRPSSGMKIK